MDQTIAAWKELELNPVFYGYGPHEHAMEDVRAKAAAFVGCKTEEIVLTNCTTEGMNWVAQGLTLNAGDRVLTSDQEHPGGRVCWDYVARKHGVIIDIVAIPPGENDAQAIIDRFAKSITPRTRVLSFSHLLSSTGLRMPVAELSALARTRGCIAVVDGAQAVGGIDVDVKALGCHVYATSGHKWLLAPKGTGLLYLSEELGTTVEPISLQAGRAAYTESSGVCNIPGVLGLAAAIDYLSAIGKQNIERHNLALSSRVHTALLSVPKLRVVSPHSGPLASPLVTYALPDDIKSGDFYRRLMERHRIVVKVVPGNWLNGNRISTHLFNTEGDVDVLIEALKEELG
jgi:selenocysteine lyase/cysteine desulfurase